MHPVNGPSQEDIEMRSLSHEHDASTLPSAVNGPSENLFANHLENEARHAGGETFLLPPASSSAANSSLAPSFYSRPPSSSGGQPLDPIPTIHNNHLIADNSGGAPLNANHGRVVVQNNSGTHTLEHNYGTHMSSGNRGSEWIDHNKNEVSIAESSGNHTIVNNDGGKIHIVNLKPGAHVLIINQNGTVHQEFPQGSLQHRLYPNGKDYPISGKSLELDQYGGEKFTDAASNLQRNPLRYVPEYVAAASAAVLPPVFLVANGGAIVPNITATLRVFSGSVASLDGHDLV